MTTHNNRSDQGSRGAQVRQVYPQFREVPSLRHDRLYRRPVGRVYLECKHDVKIYFKNPSQNGAMCSELLVMPSSTWQTGGPWHSFGSPLCGSSVPSLPLVACREVKHDGSYQI